MRYIALIEKEPGKEYGVIFPDFPGCVSMGETLDEAQTLAKEALGEHIECMQEAGYKIPTPSSLDAIMQDPDNREILSKGSIAVLVEVSSSQEISNNVSLPENIVRLIDEYALDMRMTRSAYLAHLALTKAKEKESGRKK